MSNVIQITSRKNPRLYAKPLNTKVIDFYVYSMAGLQVDPTNYHDCIQAVMHIQNAVDMTIARAVELAAQRALEEVK